MSAHTYLSLVVMTTLLCELFAFVFTVWVIVSLGLYLWRTRKSVQRRQLHARLNSPHFRNVYSSYYRSNK